ncbi:MAG: MAPEG family protein [Beijerinckiaceae bacterium]
MTVPAILSPLFAHVLLVFALGVLLAVRRSAAVRSGAVKPGPALVGDKSVWPKPALLASNAFDNQFQFPVLFYVLTILALVTKKADVLFVFMAWIFVATRFLHAAIHATTNRMPARFYAFLAGVFVLAAMWIVFVLRIVFSG